jgi:hypothetical protein
MERTSKKRDIEREYIGEIYVWKENSRRGI